MLTRRLFAVLAIGLFLPGCPLTDHYYIERGTGASGQGAAADGSSGSGATGGTFIGSGGSDGLGGDTMVGNAGTGGSLGDAGAVFGTGGDGAVGGDTSVGGSGGTRPNEGGGGSMPMNGGGGSTGGTLGAGGDAASGGDMPGSGGDMMGTGGAMAGMPGAGGMPPGAGNGPTGGAMPTGGSSTGGTWGSQYQPVCDDSVVKGSACTRMSVQRCYRGCGPDDVGVKLETCMGASYMEGDCQFPASADYSCYSVPTRLPSECPGTVPRASTACDVPTCTPCFGGMPTHPSYQDSTGAAKQGYCVCTDDKTWTCATSAAPSSWPCPGNPGCN